MLEYPTKYKFFPKTLDLVAIIIGIALLIFIAKKDEKSYVNEITGIEKYNKNYIIDKYRGDMDSAFMIFPDRTDKMIDTDYACAVKTGLFDSDGYFILKARYSEEDFKSEIERLSGIECEIISGQSKYVGKIKYDDQMYNYPAYIASDGYCNGYEYALIDEKNKEIIYVHLAYPDYEKLSKYKQYLKKNKEDYDIDSANSLERFTIYAHRFSGNDYWDEWSDGK